MNCFSNGTIPSTYCTWTSALAYCSLLINHQPNCTIHLPHAGLHMEVDTDSTTTLNTTTIQVSEAVMNFRLIIKGNHANITCIHTNCSGSGCGQSFLRMLVLSDGYNYNRPQISVDISNLTISGFGSSSLLGGALLLRGLANSVLENVRFLANTADSGGAVTISNVANSVIVGCDFISNSALVYGGALYIEACTDIDIVHSTFVGNMVGGVLSGGQIVVSDVSYGGAICVQRSSFVSITSSAILDNVGGYGGGLSVSDLVANISISRSNMENNTAIIDGGGIWASTYVSQVVLSFNSLIGNSAGTNGGGLRIAGYVSDVVIRSVFISQNSALFGGGMSVYNHVWEVRVVSCHVSENVARADGGGIWMLDDVARFTILSTIITENKANSDGGGVWLSQNVYDISISATNIVNNTAVVAGGGVRASGLVSELYISNCQINNNVAFFGGGLRFSDDVHDVVIISSNLIGNVASFGGALRFSDRTYEVDIISSVISDNVAVYNGGGGCWSDTVFNISIIATRFTHNRAAAGAGFWIFGFVSNLTFTASAINHNIASQEGGGLWLSFQVSNISMIASTVSFNQGTNQAGGFQIRDSVSNITILSSNISSNKANFGGAFWISFNVYGISVISSNISDNIAFYDGGGVWIFNAVYNIYLKRCNISGNSAITNGGGGGLWAFNNVFSIVLNGCNVSSNVASFGGGLWLSNNVRDVFIRHSNITYNRASNNGGAIVIYVTVWNVSFVSTNINYNTAVENGGGLWLYSNIENIKLLITSFLGNTAAAGGGVWMFGDISSIHFHTCNISGNTATNEGGGLWLLHYVTDIELKSCVVTGNKAGNEGGGLRMREFVSDVRIISTNITNNQARYGGGLWMSYFIQKVEIVSSRIANNIAQYDGAGLWAFLYVFQLHIHGSKIQNNQASINGGGGGVFFYYLVYDVTISQTQITENSASLGGGMVCTNFVYDITISSCNVSYNMGSSGGGLALYNNVNNITIENTNFTSNVAAVDGGGVFVSTIVSQIKFKHVNISSNIASYNGGGMRLFSIVYGISIVSSIITNNTAYGGGGIFLSQSVYQSIIHKTTISLNIGRLCGGGLWASDTVNDLTISRSKILGNAARQGGGGIWFRRVVFNIRILKSFIENNTAADTGAGLGIIDHIYNITLQDTHLLGNAANNRGGGIFATSIVYQIYIINCFFFLNSALHDSGGGLYLSENTNNINLLNTSFISNSADKNGGAVYAANNVMLIEMRSDLFYMNSAGQDGGAIHIENNCHDIILSELNLTLNTALHGSGGAISVQNSVYNIFMNESTIIGNAATMNGGALLLLNQISDVVITSSNISNNTALQGHGGGIFLSTNVNHIALERVNLISNAAGYNGGALFATDVVTDIDMNNCDVQLNTALHGSGGGMSFMYTFRDVSVRYSTVSENSGQTNGGGLFFFSGGTRIFIEDSVIAKNSALHGSGGGLFLQSQLSDIRIINTDFVDNSANMFGGGFQANADIHNLQILRSIFETNLASSGGGLYLDNNISDVSIQESVILGNIADMEGGGFALTNHIHSITLAACRVTGNSAKMNGGGAAIKNDVTSIVINSTTFSRNSASKSGGAMMWTNISQLHLLGSTFVDNSVVSDGGGILADGVSVVNITATTFNTNTAQYGGAVYLNYNCELLIFDHVIFASNVARSDGGALYINAYNGNITILSSLFTTNQATTGNGGAMMIETENRYIHILFTSFYFNKADFMGASLCSYVNNYGIFVHRSIFEYESAGYGGMVAFAGEHANIYISSCTWTSNFAAQIGGSIYIGSFCYSIHLSYSSFDSNVATQSGGAIYVSSDNYNIFIHNCIFNGNTAVSSTGGAFYAQNDNNLYIFNTTFLGNHGGALSISLTNYVHIQNCDFDINFSGNGAGIHSFNQNSLEINHCQFSGNVVSGFGGAIYIGDNHDYIQIHTNIFINNYATYGGAIATEGVNSWNINISHCEFSSNSALTTGGQLYLSFVSVVAVTDCVLQQGYVGQVPSSTRSIELTPYSNTYGGGVYIFESKNIQLKNTLLANHYGYTGGAIYAIQSEGVEVSNCIFIANRAEAYGSAIFVTAVKNISLYDSIFRNNSIPSGGMVCWNSSTMREPRGLPANDWDEPLGIVVGTSIYALRSPPLIRPMRVSDQSVLPHIEVKAVDFYGNILTSFTGLVSMSSEFEGCGEYSGYVSSEARMVKGIANFTSLILKCRPEGTYTLTFKLADTDFMSISTVVLSTFTPTATPTSIPSFTSPPTKSLIALQSNDGGVVLDRDGEIGLSVGGSVLFVFVFGGCIYFFIFSTHAKQKRERDRRLKQLPLHQCLYMKGPLRGVTDIDLLAWVKSNPDDTRHKDYDGHTPLNIIFNKQNLRPITDDIVCALLLENLPYIRRMDNVSEEGNYGNDWFVAIQQEDDVTVSAIEKVLKLNVNRVQYLANAVDANGRSSRNLAGPRCKEAILSCLYLFGRYEIREGPPEHMSATSLVVLAVDHVYGARESDGVPVALKFMHHRGQYLKEIQSREQGKFHPEFILPIICCFDIESTEESQQRFREDAMMKGYKDYPYCIVMEAASQSLKRLIDHGRVVSRDWDAIKAIVKQLAAAVSHMHSKGFIHADIKPLNILQIDHRLKLTDLDAVVNFEEGEFVGAKFSSGYIPPEMLWKDENDVIHVRSIAKYNADKYSLLPADPSYDMWALGCVIYLLCTGSPLFKLNVDDNISSQDDLLQLFLWTDDHKEFILNDIDDKYARNLVSLLLNKLPTKRISATRVLTHPFLTNRNSVRLVGEDAFWDVFLSYRVDSDAAHIEMIYNALTAKGLKVWWDKKCLLPGQPWEEGFCNGILSSSHFVCLLSRNAIKHPIKPWQNFETFDRTSPCDHLLLEWRLAIELCERDMIEGVFPVFIGDIDTATGQYSNYFATGCHPYPPDLAVDIIEGKIREYLNREGLGVPFDDCVTVSAVLSTICASQGAIWTGPAKTAVDTISSAIFLMVETSSTKKRLMSRKDRKSVGATDSHHQRFSEVLSLKQIIANLETEIASLRASNTNYNNNSNSNSNNNNSTGMI